MSFAIYGESDTYVFLATADTREKAVNMFIKDVVDTGVKLAEVFNIFAVEGDKEDKDTEDFITQLIVEDGQVVLNT